MKSKFSHNKYLLEQYQETKDNKFKNEFINKNIPLVKQIIDRRFKYPNYFDDLLQEGRLALSKAMEKYDPERGSISTLCYYSVMNRLKTFMSKTNIYGGRKMRLEPLDNSDEILLAIPVQNIKNISVLEDLINELPTEEKDLIRSRFGFDGKQKIGKVSYRELSAWESLKSLIKERGYSSIDLVQET